MIVYLHGFNSSPQSGKARAMGEWMAALGRADEYACPQLANSPAQAMDEIETLLRRSGFSPTARPSSRAEARPATDAALTLIGSSLGGFYATYLAEKFGCKAVLVNPAVRAHELLRDALGPQVNWHSNAPWEFTETHLAELAALHVATLTRRERYLLLAQTGDEVLDFRDAVAHYAGCQQIIEPDGDHGFVDFERHFQTLLDF